MKKILAVILALTMMLGVCATASAEPITIDFWTLFTGADGATMSEIVDMFNAAQDEVIVNHIVMENDDVNAKVTMSAGDNDALPHLFIQHSWRQPTYRADNAILPISMLAEAYPDFDFSMENWVPGAALYNMVGDERWCITTDFPTVMMYANVELVNEWGPGVLDDGVLTWDEVGQIADKIEAEGSDMKIVGASGKDVLMGNYWEKGFIYGAGDELAIDREGLLASIKPWETYFDRGVLWEEGDDVGALFAVEEIMFLVDGSWSSNHIKEYGFEYMMLPTPMLDAETAYVDGGQHAMFLPQRTYTDEELQAVGKFVEFFFENEIKWAEAASVLAYVPATELEEYKTYPQYALNSFRRPISLADPFVHNDVVETTLGELGMEVLYGNMTAEEYVDVLIKTCEERIEAKNAN